MSVLGKLSALATIALAIALNGQHASAYNKFCSQDSDCNAPGSYCMKDPTKQPFDVFYCHGDQDYCRGDGDCEPGDYCLNDPPHAPMKKYMCAGALSSSKTKKVEARVVLNSFDKDWCYATAGTDAKKCAFLVKEQKCTWYPSKDGKTGKCAMKKETLTAKPYYHVMAKGDNQCYMTKYIDANYKKQGYVPKKCPSNFKVQAKSQVKVCSQHSEINIKDCKTKVITITLFKMGITANAVEETRPRFYHVMAKGDNQCYMTRYIDTNYKKQGYVPYKCPSSFNRVQSKNQVKVCSQHSEINIKDCQTKVITITLFKMGIASTGEDSVIADEEKPVLQRKVGNLRKQIPAKELGLSWHLLSSQSTQCFESNYSDKNFRKQGYRFGKCPSVFNTVTNVDKEQICFGHSEIAIKDCPTKVVTISIRRKGKSASN